MDPQSSNKKLNSNKRRIPNKYRECHKNHAASLGAHALDGCLQYIPSSSSDPSEPSSLTCAACACHRNFHRLVVSEDEDDDDDDQNNNEEEEEAAGSHVLLTLKTGAGGPAPVSQPKEGISVGLRRKRYRSKFTNKQKEGMMELAETVGWRLQRRDEEVVEEACRRMGVERGVFKVWMHNNKHGVMEMKRKNQKKKIILENHDKENGNIIGDNYYKGVVNESVISDKDGNNKTTSTL